MGYAVRPMQDMDVAQVTEVDREAFPTQWPPPSFKKDLSNSVIRYLVAYEEGSNPYYQPRLVQPKADLSVQRVLSKIRCLFDRKYSSNEKTVTQPFQAILGYASMWLMVDEAHLTSIAVRETHRRQGIGELLLVFIIDLSLQVNAQVVTLEVRSSNLAAQALYEKYGFAKVGVRRGYYSDDGEDAIIMTTETITSASYQEKFQQLKEEYLGKWGTMRGCLR